MKAMHHRLSVQVLAAVLVIAAGAWSVRAQAPAGSIPAPAVEAATWADEMHFDYRAAWRVYPQFVELDKGTADMLPGSLLPASRSEISNLRLDLRASPYEVIDLELKPRYELAYQEWRQGIRKGDENWTESAYLNGWLMQVRLWDQLALAYSREDLQWGPSYLVSPSNPFRNSNGRNLPQIELAGMDFLKAIWTPSANWSFSALANVDDGRANLPPLAIAGDDVVDQVEFHKTYALKADYTFETCTFSLIGSTDENHDQRLGSYASMNVSDSILAYAEGGMGQGGDIDYLLGSSYTLCNGGTLTAEFYHNSMNSDEDTAGFARLITPTGPYAGFINSNYSLLQYRQGEILNHVEFVARWIHCLDDDSDRLAGEVECVLNDHASLFMDGMVDLGTNSQEYGILTQYIVLAGVKISL
jgi:hypothetical protein